MARRYLTSNTPTPPTTAGTGAAPPAPHSQWDLHRPVVRMAILGNVVVVVLFFVAIVWRLFFSGKGQEGAVAADQRANARGGVASAPDASSSGASSQCASPRATRLSKEDLMALPVYVHGASAEGGGGNVECAVCICELRDSDTARLLPRCGHRFHAECVDRWFRSQATCPLCRAVVADGGFDEADHKAQLGV